VLQAEAVHAQDWHMPEEPARCPSRWGAEDQRGSANLIKPASIVNAAKLIRTGEVFELGDVLTSDPAVSYINRGRVFNVYTKPALPLANTRVAHEELIITELGQIGTQLDGFAHQMYGESFYNCFKFKDIMSRTGFSKLGIENVGTLMSRGVLIDIAALKQVAVLPDDYVITANDIEQALKKQQLRLQQGDAVLIHTGWGVTRGRDNARYGNISPGIGVEAGAWLVEHDPLLIGSDTCCVEARSPELERTLPVHTMMLIQHGIYLLENLRLADLAAAEVYEFAFITQPLKLKGATGSAVAPVAIR
jgi:kynurenine formamidase